MNASSAELSSNLERLSSGKRINHASDDAAGLAVSSTLNATARIHTQAARNVNDGISFLNVADGATSALKDILFRMRELSTQSSNGTFSNAQRQSIDKESQALQAEYGRILDTTSFNGIRVFGSGDVTVQAGVGTRRGAFGELSSAVSTSSNGDGTFQAKQSFGTGDAPDSVAVADFNGDGKSDLVTADATAAPRACCSATATARFRPSVLRHRKPAPFVAVGDFNGDGKSDLVVADYNSDTVSVLLGNGNGTFQARQAFGTGSSPCSVAVGDFNGDGKSDLVTADYVGNTVSVLLGNGNGTFQAKQDFGTGCDPCSSPSATSTATASVTWSRGRTQHRERAARQRQRHLSGQAAFGTGSWPTRSPWATSTATARATWSLRTTTPHRERAARQRQRTFQARQSSAPESPTACGRPQRRRQERPGNRTLRHRERAARQRQRYVSGQAVLGTGTTCQLLWRLQRRRGERPGTADCRHTVSVLLGNGTTTTTYGLQPITGVSLATQAYAPLAQGQIDGYLESVNKVSGAIGTALSRFQIAAHVASSVADVSQAAEVRITDADVADNSAASSGTKSSSKRRRPSSPRRTNNPRWRLPCYASR